jgi:glycerol-3-phosphate acyltransferase PlsY
MVIPILVWLSSYLIGSLPFGWLIARARGVDIFQEGSGNIGATNVARVLGKPLGILVFLLDFAKGAGPVAVASRLADDTLPPGMLEVGAGLAAFLGHLFPLYLRFRGGKGVATAAGVVSVLFPIPALAGFLAFVSVLTATRLVSLGSLAAAVVLVATYFLLQNAVDVTDPRAVFALIALTLVFVRHGGNIARLRAGTERQISANRFLEPTARSLHVLSLGLWCGMGVCFTLMTAIQFRDLETLGKSTDRPTWFPLPAMFERSDDVVKNGPAEQGSRAFGFAVNGIFPPYFLAQFLCGVVALGTALGWPRLRPWLSAAALALLCVGWPIEHKVADLRPHRNAMTDAYLQADAAERNRLAPETIAVRSTFVRWHLASLFLNFGVVGLVIVATTLAGNLSVRGSPQESADGTHVR